MKMKYYMAPMEASPAIYTATHTTPAIIHGQVLHSLPVPKGQQQSKLRELNDISARTQPGMYVVPQILTNQAEDFIRTAKELQEYGYSEINLNLGCPSGTVVSKYKGAGFLGLPDSLDRFLDEVCGKMEGMGMELSVKTRLGLVSPDEFTGLLEIYNRYPLKELILHPRVRTDYYKTPRTCRHLAAGLTAAGLRCVIMGIYLLYLVTRHCAEIIRNWIESCWAVESYPIPDCWTELRQGQIPVRREPAKKP